MFSQGEAITVIPTREIIKEYADLHSSAKHNIEHDHALTNEEQKARGSLKEYLRAVEKISESRDIIVNCDGLSLSNSNLYGADFQGISARNAKFNNTYLRDVSFKGSDLTGAMFVMFYHPDDAREEGDGYDDGGYMQEYVIPHGETRRSYYDAEHYLSQLSTIDFTEANLSETQFGLEQRGWYSAPSEHSYVTCAQLLSAYSIFKIRGLKIDVPDQETQNLIDQRINEQRAILNKRQPRFGRTIVIPFDRKGSSFGEALYQASNEINSFLKDRYPPARFLKHQKPYKNQTFIHGTIQSIVIEEETQERFNRKLLKHNKHEKEIFDCLQKSSLSIRCIGCQLNNSGNIVAIFKSAEIKEVREKLEELGVESKYEQNPKYRDTFPVAISIIDVLRISPEDRDRIGNIIEQNKRRLMAIEPVPVKVIQVFDFDRTTLASTNDKKNRAKLNHRTEVQTIYCNNDISHRRRAMP